MGKKNAKGGGGPRSADTGARGKGSGSGSAGMSPLPIVVALFTVGTAVYFTVGPGAAGAAEAEGHRSLADDGVELECGPADMEHLSDLPAQGLHVLTAADAAASCAAGGAGSFKVRVHTDGSATPGDAPPLELACTGANVNDWLVAALKALVSTERPALHNRLQAANSITSNAMMELSSRSGLDRWNFFTPYGTPVAKNPAAIMRAFTECGVVYVYEGGNFVWPGIRVGHNITLETGDDKFGFVTLTTLSLQPRVFTIDPLLTKDECKWIIKKAEPEMVESPVSHM